MFSINDYNHNDALVDSLFAIDREYPHRKNDFYKSLSQSALAQQMWWAEELLKIKSKFDRVNFYGAGYAFYHSVLITQFKMKDVVFYDLDPEVRSVNWKALQNVRKTVNIEQRTLDVLLDHDYVRRDVDLVVNTSCESMYHMKNIVINYEDPLFVFQGAKSYDRGNINIHENLESFIESTGLTDIKYSGTKTINNNDRYMVIGYA